MKLNYLKDRHCDKENYIAEGGWYFHPPPFAEGVNFFRIKGWAVGSKIVGIKGGGGPKFAFQNFEVGSSVLIEELHTPETKKYHFSKIYRLLRLIILFFHA